MLGRRDSSASNLREVGPGESEENMSRSSEKDSIPRVGPIDSSLEALSARGEQRNRQLDGYFRRRLRKQQEKFRASIDLDTSSLEGYEQATAKLRARLLQELGGWPQRPDKVKANVELLGEIGPGKLYEVNVSILDDVEMPALLLIPKDAETTPKPAVICQHGYGASPEWAMGFDTPGISNYMNSAGHRLASAGYVVIAPRIVCSPPGGGADRVRFDRLAKLGGNSLLGFEMFELSRIVDYLQTRSEVKADAIGMYGISQGGMSTLFFSALEERIKAAVCSCYFNNRWNKMLEEDHLSRATEAENLTYETYLSLTEDDKFDLLAAPLWDDHILGALVCPRPFMAEIGRYDYVIYWRDAVEEFERLKKIYMRLGISDKVNSVVAEWGAHEMFFDDAKVFLDRWLL